MTINLANCVRFGLHQEGKQATQQTRYGVHLFGCTHLHRTGRRFFRRLWLGVPSRISRMDYPHYRWEILPQWNVTVFRNHAAAPIIMYHNSRARRKISLQFDYWATVQQKQNNNPNQCFIMFTMPVGCPVEGFVLINAMRLDFDRRCFGQKSLSPIY